MLHHGYHVHWVLSCLVFKPNTSFGFMYKLLLLPENNTFCQMFWKNYRQAWMHFFSGFYLANLLCCSDMSRIQVMITKMMISYIHTITWRRKKHRVIGGSRKLILSMEVGGHLCPQVTPDPFQGSGTLQGIISTGASPPKKIPFEGLKGMLI